MEKKYSRNKGLWLGVVTFPKSSDVHMEQWKYILSGILTPILLIVSKFQLIRGKTKLCHVNYISP